MALSLGACATPSTPGAMVPTLVEANLIQDGSSLYQAVSVGEVTGGKKTNPLWTSQVASEDFAEALGQTLSAHAMLASDGAEYSLDADLISLKQPVLGGFNMTVTSTVDYTLTDLATENIVFEDQVQTPYTAQMSDAFVGVERLKLANEGSIKANLAEMMNRLVAAMNAESSVAASEAVADEAAEDAVS